MSAALLRGTDREAEVTQATAAYEERSRTSFPAYCCDPGHPVIPGLPPHLTHLTPHSVSSIATMAIPIDSRQTRTNSGRSPHPTDPSAAAAGISRTPDSST